MATNNSGGGIGFLGALFLIFMTLKLTDVIDWSWWWVTAPLWAIPSILVVIGFFWLIGLVIVMLKERARVKRELKVALDRLQDDIVKTTNERS